ncbi:MAG: hypothetical protein ISR52_07195 [Rhodospirillales bacterium]|nr:hypothetical protein [Rhodospirillales bacterium]
MQAIFRFALLLAVVAALPFGGAVAAEKDIWRVTKSMQGAVDHFIKNSAVFEDMRTYSVPNDPVYVKETDVGPLLPIYDLLACIQLTHPKAVIEVDSGGGFDIAIDYINFAKGSWPVDIRIVEIKQINKLEKHSIYILEKVSVGTLSFSSAAQMTQTLRLMTSKCFNSDV